MIMVVVTVMVDPISFSVPFASTGGSVAKVVSGVDISVSMKPLHRSIALSAIFASEIMANGPFKL